ncbi:MAG TPA: ribonuclease P protein component [Gallionella sp.]|nr:ribonuclease P protein component [Gallionella sp.]
MAVLLSMHVAPRAAPGLQFKIPAKFTAAHRLLRADGYDHVVHAENIEDKYFKIYFVGNRRKNARLGIISGKKLFSCAVSRNRVRRAIREVFRRHKVKTCRLDIVVMAKRAYAQESDTHSGSLDILFTRIENQCVNL